MQVTHVILHFSNSHNKKEADEINFNCISYLTLYIQNIIIQYLINIELLMRIFSIAFIQKN